LKPVVESYVPPAGIRHAVTAGETWISLAKRIGIDPWDLIEFNFPGIKLVKQRDFQQATRQVNWYLAEYVGCRAMSHVHPLRVGRIEIRTICEGWAGLALSDEAPGRTVDWAGGNSGREISDSTSKPKT